MHSLQNKSYSLRSSKSFSFSLVSAKCNLANKIRNFYMTGLVLHCSTFLNNSFLWRVKPHLFSSLPPFPSLISQGRQAPFLPLDSFGLFQGLAKCSSCNLRILVKREMTSPENATAHLCSTCEDWIQTPITGCWQLEIWYMDVRHGTL